MNEHEKRKRELDFTEKELLEALLESFENDVSEEEIEEFLSHMGFETDVEAGNSDENTRRNLSTEEGGEV